MKLEVKQEPFPHIIIYNYFTEDELNHIWKELKFLTNPAYCLGHFTCSPCLQLGYT